MIRSALGCRLCGVQIILWQPAVTQAKLYRKITGDNSYEEMEAALTDWLFGCNPWGTSMICGLPAGGDYPEIPHSSLTRILKITTTGGLVDGPVYLNTYKSQLGISLQDADEYAAFQKGKGSLSRRHGRLLNQ